MEDLKATRSTWLHAYLAADTEALRAIELPDFNATSEYGTEDTSSRYEVIEHRKRNGQWFRSSATVQDLEIAFEFSGDERCRITGSGRIHAQGKTIRESDFSELWVKQDDQWKVQQLQVTNIR